jgi:putative transposase
MRVGATPVAPATSASLAPIHVSEITAARNARRRALRQGLRDRNKVVDQLLAVHQPDYDHPVHGPSADPEPVYLAEPPTPPRTLKLYRED